MALENEQYVLDLCDEALGLPSHRQWKFDWLHGDSSPKTGKSKALPVDAYYPTLGLVVEFHEKQHYEAVAHFDKPDKLTVSGVHRGIQRKKYDDRRRELIPAHNLALVIIRMDDFKVKGRFIDRRHDDDLEVVKRALGDLVTR